MDVVDSRVGLEIAPEFGDADLGDARLSRRLGELARKLADRPGASFPKALDDAELEAAYRFFGNAKVTPEAILAPHFRQSARRSSRCKRIIVAHDTTAFEFGGKSSLDGCQHSRLPDRHTSTNASQIVTLSTSTCTHDHAMTAHSSRGLISHVQYLRICM